MQKRAFQNQNGVEMIEFGAISINRPQIQRFRRHFVQILSFRGRNPDFYLLKSNFVEKRNIKYNMRSIMHVVQHNNVDYNVLCALLYNMYTIMCYVQY